MPGGFTYIQIDAPLATPDAYAMPYLVLGATHDVKVGTFNIPASTGNVSITGVGFQPECLLIFGAVTFLGSAFDEAFLHLGVATDPSEQWAMSVFCDDNVAPDSMIRTRRWAEDKIISQVSHLAADFSASLVSFDANGFTLNVDDAPGIALPAVYVAIRGGGPYTAGVASAPGSPGSQLLPVGYVPAAMLFGTVGVNSTGIHDDYSFCVGAADATRQHSTWSGAKRLALNTGAIQSPTSVINLADVNTAPTVPVLTARAERVDLDAGGGDVELDWTTALAHRFGWLAIGQDAAVDRFFFTPGGAVTAVTTPIKPEGLFGFCGSYLVGEDDQVVIEGAVHSLSAVDATLTSEVSCSIKDGSSPTLSVPQSARDMKTGMWGCYLRDVGGLVGTGAGSMLHRLNLLELLDFFIPQIYRRVVQRLRPGD